MRSTFGTPLLCALLLGSLLIQNESDLFGAPSDAAEAANAVWGTGWKTGHDALDSAWELQRAIENFPAIPGLSRVDTRIVATEIALRRFHDVVLATGLPKRGVEILEEFIETPLHPSVQSQAQHLLAIFYHLSGDFEGARREWSSLGFLRSFQLIGPFENERGSGFRAQYPPETEVDLEAEYPGKRGSVSWRSWNEMGIAGQIELGELLRPSEESLAYLVSWIESPKATDAVIRVGSSGAYRIWIDDVEVPPADVERPLRLDQDAIPIRLRPGVQQIRILSGQQKGRWAIRVRFTDDAGAPLEDIKVTELPPGEGLVAPPAGFDPRRESSPDLGARSRLSRAEPTAWPLHLSGWIAAEVHAHDLTEHPDREAYRAAIRLDPDNPHLRYALAESYQQTVGHAAEREENPRRQALEETLDLDPTFNRARFALIEYYLDRFNNLTKASELFKSCWEHDPATRDIDRSPQLLELGRRILSLDLGSEAGRPLEMMLIDSLKEKQELRVPVRLTAYRMAQQRGELKEAQAILDEGLELFPLQDELLFARAEFATSLGDLETTRSLLSRRVAARPLQTSGWVALAGFEQSVDRLDSALIALDEALRIAPQSERYLVQRGHLLHLLERDTAARDSWARALELEPNQPKLRALTEYLQSSSPGIEEEFRIDMSSRITAALNSAVEEEDPYHILLENQASDVQEDGTAVRYHQKVMRVLTDAGIRQLDTHVVPYAYGEQWVRILKARIHRPDGSYADARIRNRDPAVREGEYPVWSRALVDLPPLTKGDVVELEYLVEDLRQSFFGDYFGEKVLFGGYLPRSETVYTVRFPSERVLYRRTHQLEEPLITETGQKTTWQWRSTAESKVEPEPAGPPVAELVPHVEISSYKTWDEFATWYHHLIRRQFEVSPEIRAKVEELTSNTDDKAEQVRRICEFVANEIRYIAWEFGVHGFQPYNASTIFTRRFGDCKDKATLICTMLSELDIDAWPVLINGTRQRPLEDLSLPMVSHFNHCIAYVPSIDGGLFIDGTAENHGMNELPMMDYGAEIVVIKDDGAERHQIPWNTPSQFSISERTTVELEVDGSAKIQQEDVLVGEFAVLFRDQFEISSKRAEQIERVLARRYPGIEVQKVEVSDLNDLSQPVTLSLKLAVPKLVELGSAEVELPPIRDLLSSLEGVGNAASRPSRNESVLLGNPKSGFLRVELQLPEGYEVSSLPESLELRSDTAQCDFKYFQEGDKVVVERTYQFPSPRVDPTDYANFKRVVDQIEQSLDERIVLQPSKEVN